jgi:hypothetical protein
MTVYVIVPEKSGRPAKIGKSINPIARLKAIQSHSPVKLKLHMCLTESEFYCDAAVEADAHSILKKRRLHGEWFDVDGYEASEAVYRAHSDYVRIKRRSA